MNPNTHRNTLLNIPLMEERYGRSVLASIAIHGLVALLILFGGYLLPSVTIQLGGGIGGGAGEDVPTVGVAAELSGGTGMVKPGLVPKPPALLDKPRQDTSKAIPLPDTVEPKRKRVSAKEAAKTAEAISKTNVIPTTPEPGSGGVAGQRSGGSGIGISIGSGANAFGDHWYARRVEARISENWMRPAPGVHVEMIYSFYIASNGRIYGVRQEKSSGNPQMDLTAERAINASNPLSPPPPEFRGRPVKFVANFVYPLNP
jgi:TonB family protein